MRLLYLTAHLSDVDVVRRALAKLSPPVEVEACATAPDALAQWSTGVDPDGVLVDTAPPFADPLTAIAEIRAGQPETVIVALVRPGADDLAAEALVAGADDTLVKHKEFYLQAPALIAAVRRRRSEHAAHAASVFRVLHVGDRELPTALDPARVELTHADAAWWAAPAERTAQVQPDVVVIDEPRSAAALAGAIKALRDQAVTVPVILVTEETSPEALATWQRLGVAAVVPPGERPRLAEVVDRVITVTRLAADLAVLRARERRLRAIVESVPTAVVLVQGDGTLLAVNFAALALIGAKEASQIVGQRVNVLCQPMSAVEVRRFVERVCAGTPGLIRFAGRGIDGEPRIFDLRAVPLRRDEDTTVALGVMRLAPVAEPEPVKPSAGPGEEIEIPLTSLAEPSLEEQAALAELEALKVLLDAEQQALAEARGKLDEASTREVVSEAAWAAIQSELQRKLVLQATSHDTEREHEVTRALLERSLREKDAQLLATVEERNRALSRLHHAERERDQANDAVAERDADIARLRKSLEDALAERAAALEAARQHEVRLAALISESEQETSDRDSLAAELRALREMAAAVKTDHQQLAATVAERDRLVDTLTAERDRLQQALDAARAELTRLTTQDAARDREQAALVDVRQQVARLQAAAATVEQQQRALDEAHDQLERLRNALEDALGTRTDLERTLSEREAQLQSVMAEREQVMATARDLEARLAEGQGERDAVTRDLEARTRELETLRQERDAAHAAHEHLAQEADDLRVQLAARQDDAVRWQAERETLAATLHAAEAALDARTRELETLRQERDAAHAARERLAQEADDLRVQLAARQDDAVRWQAERETLAATLHAAEAALDARTRELETLRQERDAAHVARERLAQEADDLRVQLAARQDDAVRWQAERETLAATLHAAEAALDARTRELDDLHAALEARGRELETMRTTLAASTRDLDLARGEIDLRARDLQAQRDALELAAQELAALREDLSQTRAGLDAARREVELRRQEAEQWQRQAEARESETAQLRGLIDERDGLVSQLRMTLSDRESAAAALQRELEQWRARYEGARQQLDALVSELDTARAQALQAASVAPALSSLQASYDTLTSELTVVRQQLEAAQQRGREVEALRDELERLRREHADMVSAREALQEQAETLRRRLDEVAGHAQAAQQRADATTLELQQLQEARNQLQQALAEERALRDQLQQRLAEAEAETRELRVSLAAGEAEIGSLRVSLDAMGAERETLRQALTAAMEARTRDTGLIEDLTARMAKAESRLAATLAQEDTRQSELQTLRLALERARAERDSLTAQLAEAEATRRALLDDQQSLRDQIAALNDRISAERRAAADLEADRNALRESLARADANAQLLASRQAEEREALAQMLDETRTRLARAEAQWRQERADLERALAARAEAQQRLMQSGVIGLATTTLAGVLLRANDTLAAFLGYRSASDLVGRPDSPGLPFIVDWQAFARDLAAAAGPLIVEAPVQRPDGRVAWLQAYAAVLADPVSGATHVEWTVVDATDRYLRLRQQHQARRLDAVRELAVSAGRELLDAVGARLAGQGIDVSGRPGPDVPARVREIAQQLVTFAQRQGRPAQLVDLAETLAHLRVTLGRLVGDDVALTVEPWRGPLVVTADPGELEQWITSITVAVRDVMPAVGSLSIAPRLVDLATAAPGDRRHLTPMAVLAWRATGLGIRALALPAAVVETVAQRGGLVREMRDTLSATAGADLMLPAVVSACGGDDVFPLLRSSLPHTEA